MRTDIRAFLDWAAGAPPLPEAALAAAQAAGAGNPSSVHAEGRAARAILERARAAVAELCGALPSEVVFTASASEASATALLGVMGPALAAGESPTLVLSGLEHPSVRLTADLLASRGATLRSLSALPSGIVDPEAFGEALASGATLVALQAVNHETGAVQPVAEVSGKAREAGARMHVDAAQAAGKLDMGELWARADTLVLSATKLGGIPGAGALLVRSGVSLPPLIPGHQERGRRGGTHALPAIAAFGVAASRAVVERDARMQGLSATSLRIEAAVRASGGTVNAAGVPRVPGIVSATFEGADGETLLVALDLAGVSCSHGAACSTGAMEPSEVLLAMGFTRQQARGTVRFSAGFATSSEELELLEHALPRAVQQARGASRQDAG